MAYQLIPGVKSDHRGRKFQVARYPNGKVIEVPYAANGAEPARMIPVPPEPQRKTRALPTYTDPATGERRKVLHVPKRLHVVELRWTKRSPHEREVAKLVTNPKTDWRFLASLQPLVRLNGDKVAEILQPASCDYHVQYHIDEEVK